MEMPVIHQQQSRRLHGAEREPEQRLAHHATSVSVAISFPADFSAAAASQVCTRSRLPRSFTRLQESYRSARKIKTFAQPVL